MRSGFLSMIGNRRALAHEHRQLNFARKCMRDSSIVGEHAEEEKGCGENEMERSR